MTLRNVTRTPGRVLTSGAAGLLLLGALTGCGTRTAGDVTEAGGQTSPQATATGGSAPGDEPTSSDGSAAPDATAGAASSDSSPADAGTADGGATAGPDDATTGPAPATDRRRTTLRDRLLPADDLPGPTADGRWRVERTRTSEGKRPFTTCQDYALTSIGALRVVTRTYVPVGDSTATAGHLVAVFPDSATARRAFEVLRSWRGDCDDNLAGHDHHAVGRAQSVSVADPAVASYYQLQYGPTEHDAASDWFEDQGLARSGSYVTLVQMRVAGQDHDQPSGQEPVTAALRTAVDRLG